MHNNYGMRFLWWQFIWLLLFYARTSSCAQSIDSLKQLLETTNSDSSKAYLCAGLAKGYFDKMDLDNVYRYSTEGLNLARMRHDTLAMTLNLEYVGQATYYYGLYEKCLSIYFQVLKDAERLNKPDMQARAYRMMGWVDLEINEFEEGLRYFEKALAIFKRIGSPTEDVALTLWGIGEMKYELNLNREAKVYFDSAVQVKPGLKLRERGLLLTEIGAYERNTNHNLAAAFRSINQAIRLLERSQANRDAYAYALAELSLSYHWAGDLVHARESAEKSHELYSTVPFRRRYVGIYKVISKAFQTLGDFENAYQVEVEIRTLMDSVFQRRNQVLIADMKAQYESEKKQNEIALLEQKVRSNAIELSARSRIIALTITASLLILGLAGIIFVMRLRYQRKAKEAEAQDKLRKEKERIKQDLHDSLGSQLSSISLGLNSLLKSNGSGSVESLLNLANEAVTELRDSLWILEQETVPVGELEQKINTLLWHYRKINLPIQFELIVAEDVKDKVLTPLIAGNLFKIIQEAVQNAVRHSEAHNIKISLSKDNNVWNVMIEDNGSGFSLQDSLDKGRHGLGNMKKRAELLKADFSIRTGPGEGTAVLIRLAAA